MTQRAKQSQQGVQSIEVGARLLQALTDSRRPLMLRDLAAAAGMPAAKAHRYLVSFTRMGLVRQQPETGCYDLGEFALEVGFSALARLDPVAIANAQLPGLAKDISQTVALAVWGNHGPTIVRWVGADAPVTASLRVGSVLSLTRSATGNAFLGFLPKETLAPLISRELKENAKQGLTPTTPKEVERMIRKIRRQGHSLTSSFIAGITGIAVPIFDNNDAVALVLVSLGYTSPFTASLDSIVRAVRDRAAQISKRIGHPGRPRVEAAGQ